MAPICTPPVWVDENRIETSLVLRGPGQQLWHATRADGPDSDFLILTFVVSSLLLHERREHHEDPHYIPKSDSIYTTTRATSVRYCTIHTKIPRMRGDITSDELSGEKESRHIDRDLCESKSYKSIPTLRTTVQRSHLRGTKASGRSACKAADKPRMNHKLFFPILTLPSNGNPCNTIPFISFSSPPSSSPPSLLLPVASCLYADARLTSSLNNRPSILTTTPATP